MSSLLLLTAMPLLKCHSWEDSCPWEGVILMCSGAQDLASTCPHDNYGHRHGQSHCMGGNQPTTIQLGLKAKAAGPYPGVRKGSPARESDTGPGDTFLAA